MPRPPVEVFSLHSRVLLALVAVVGLGQVFRWLAARRLGSGSSLLWIGVFLGLLVVAAFPTTVVWLGELTGAHEPEGGLRLAAFVFIFLMLLYLSVRLSQLQQRIDDLVQALALRDAASPDGDQSGRRIDA